MGEGRDAMKNCHASAFPAPRMSDCKISTSDTLGKNYAKSLQLSEIFPIFALEILIYVLWRS